MAWNEYIGGLIGNAMGKLEENDLDHDEFECGEFMCIRVSIDLTKPLLLQKKVNIGLPESV